MEFHTGEPQPSTDREILIDCNRDWRNLFHYLAILEIFRLECTRDLHHTHLSRGIRIRVNSGSNNSAEKVVQR